MRVGVLGSGGYVGGRLIPRLLQEGFEVTVIARSESAYQPRSWFGATRVITVDLATGAGLENALQDCDVACYLSHSLNESNYVEDEIRNAKTFAENSKSLRQIIYLGGMPTSPQTSVHLETKQRVAEILAQITPTLNIQVGPIIGSGSASYELMRDLTRRLPLILTGPWGNSKLSVIGVDDLLEAVINGIKSNESGTPMQGDARCGTYPEPVRNLMLNFSSLQGRTLKSFVLPFLPVAIVAEIANLMTRLPRALIRRLLESVPYDSVGPNELGETLLGRSYQSSRTTISKAISDDQTGLLETRWSDSDIAWDQDITMEEKRGSFRVTTTTPSKASKLQLYRSVSKLGGHWGWGGTGFLWNARGWIDKALGGPGLSRGRRVAEVIRPGDTIDFWRVRHAQQGKKVILEAEFLLPGRGFLIYEIDGPDSEAVLKQTAIFEPHGFWGWLYWMSTSPIHKLIFASLSTRLIQDAESRSFSSPH